MQLQDIPSDISGDDSCNSDNEQQTVENDYSVESDSSEEEIIEPLRKRASLSGTKESVVELQSSVRRKCGKAKVDCDQSVVIAQEDMAIDECDKTNIRQKLPFNLEKVEQFEKTKKSIQNISSVAPGPTKFSKERIHNAFDAFKILIHSTMIHWIVNFAEIEANR